MCAKNLLFILDPLVAVHRSLGRFLPFRRLKRYHLRMCVKNLLFILDPLVAVKQLKLIAVEKECAHTRKHNCVCK